jgi:phosphatidylserine/phosphatidylglycerophosphate/cardiolipin synthase-like enzyme
MRLKRALNRGVDVQIVYHGVSANAKAIAEAKLPKTHGGKQVLFERTKTKIPHNKFIVKLAGAKAKAVWTGSTNFTDTGLFGQTNVGHLVVDDGVAAKYLDYWKELSGNPVHSVALANAIALTPNPPNAIAKDSIVEFYSPRIADNMLDWYGQRIDDGASMAAMTIPFNVAPALLKALSKKLDSIRVVILEDVPTKEVRDAEFQNKGLLVFSNGAILGKNMIKFKAGGGKVTPIPKSHIDDWFLSEELARPVNQGHVFFMHAKFVLIDPLSDDPLVCSGSANFSTNSLENNDENMLLIRGSKRVADIYLTEFDRIFRHFYTRDAINRIASKGNQKNPLELDEKFVWIAPNFQTGTYKNNRRLMFFPKTGGGAAAAQPWSNKAATDPNPFADEAQRAKDKKAKKAAAAKARKTTGKKTGKNKKATSGGKKKKKTKRKPK